MNIIYNDLLDILKQCKNEGQGVRLIFSSLKASASGLSRTFKIHVITKDGDIYNLTWMISQILHETFTKDGKIRVYGCGMDMLFNTCYRLNEYLYDFENPRTEYNHDAYYHGYVNTFYDLL